MALASHRPDRNRLRGPIYSAKVAHSFAATVTNIKWTYSDSSKGITTDSFGTVH